LMSNFVKASSDGHHLRIYVFERNPAEEELFQGERQEQRHETKVRNEDCNNL